MTQLDLSDDEPATLRHALETYLSDQRIEIADTDAHDFREGLKEEESTIKRLLEQLRVPWRATNKVVAVLSPAAGGLP